MTGDNSRDDRTKAIASLQTAVRDFCDARDWSQFHTPKDLALSLVLESTEVLEHFQWRNGKELDVYLKKNKDDVAEELADVLYWTLRMTDMLDIDLVQAFDAKLKKNGEKYPVEKAKGNHKKYTEHQG